MQIGLYPVGRHATAMNKTAIAALFAAAMLILVPAAALTASADDGAAGGGGTGGGGSTSGGVTVTSTEGASPPSCYVLLVLAWGWGTIGPFIVYGLFPTFEQVCTSYPPPNVV